MEADFGTEIDGQHLRAEADPQKRLAFPQRHPDPIDFGAHERILVVGAHRAPENDAAAVLLQCRWQRITEARLANVEGMHVAHEPLPDMARIVSFLVQNDAHGRLGRQLRVLRRDLTDRALLRALGRGGVKHWSGSGLVVAAAIRQWEPLVYAA